VRKHTHISAVVATFLVAFFVFAEINRLFPDGSLEEASEWQFEENLKEKGESESSRYDFFSFGGDNLSTHDVLFADLINTGSFIIESTTIHPNKSEKLSLSVLYCCLKIASC